MSNSRREFLRATVATAFVPYASRSMADETKAPNDRPRVGCIGNGGMGGGDANAISRYGDIVAFCDVDRSHAEKLRANKNLKAESADIHEDYRELLDRKDIDVVTISTPDHWHSRILLDACRAGKDVYCQKPLTLTIDEGKTICKVVKQTGRVVQVGTQQRSEYNNRFLTAVAMVQEGRIGRIKRVVCSIGGAPKGGPFEKADPPDGLNWDLWLGQAPMVDYIKQRCHGTFRWWYEYSGGKLTDWGAHHVDIAQWAIGMDKSGPLSVEPVEVTHPQKLDGGLPTDPASYNTATKFMVRCLFPNDAELLIRDDGENGVTFEGEKGTFFVSRGRLSGEPVDALRDNPIAESVLVALRKGKRLDRHMGNFIECVRDRSTPVSDVFTHHRALTTCHLANIAMRLGRTLKWDAQSEKIVGDTAADAWQAREQRKGFEVHV